MDNPRLEGLALQLRRDIVTMITEAKSGHPGGSLSCVEILCALYFGGILNYDPQNPLLPERDRFILSKGHAAPALYAALAHAGYFPAEELTTLRKLDSRLQGHPDSNRLPGVEVSTGSLGQGLSISCGIACGLRLERLDSAVFCLLGDGECQEGQVWEAAAFAAHNKLDNLVAIIDNNRLQIDGTLDEVCSLGDIGAKFCAFGWESHEVDGHDLSALRELLKGLKASRSGRPKVVIANTVKGKGVSFMENKVSWHGVAPKPEEGKKALKELTAPAECGPNPISAQKEGGDA